MSSSNNGHNKQRTLASVLEKQNKEQKFSRGTDRGFNNSTKGSRLAKPTQIEKQKDDEIKEKLELKTHCYVYIA